MLFPVQVGSSCNFTDTLGYSVVGRTTFTYNHPYLYLIDAGADFPSPDVGYIKIYDCSNPAGITLISTTATPFFSGPERPLVVGNVLVLPYRRPNTPAQATTAGVPGQQPQLSCWDISDKTAPVQLGAINLGYNSAGGQYNRPWDVEVIGNTACCPIGSAFNTVADAVAVDISDPSSPTLIQNFKQSATQYAMFGVLKFGGYFFLIGQKTSGGPLAVISVPESGFPASGGNEVTSGTTFDALSSFAMSADGQRIFVALASGRFWVVDISTPTAPATISLTTPFGSNPTDCNPMVAIGQTDRLYVGNSAPAPGRITILETVSATPTITGTITLTHSPLEFQPIQAECAGFAYTMFGSTDVTLLGTAPLS